jgi:translation initiation factor 2A
VWSTSDGALRASLHHRQYAPELFPPLRWTCDQKLCARVGNDVVHLYDGEFPSDASAAGSGEPTSLQRLAAPGVTAVWVTPAPGPLYSFVTFAPAKGSKSMGAALMWSMPRLSEPVAARSLQADGASVKFAPDGHAALIELTQVASDEHYDGDSRLFLLSRDGATNVAIMPPKDGSVHDFAWSPRSDFFIVIAGKSPPAATLYSRKAVATFSFGAAAHNTIRISPNAHVVMLGGFGNMGGTMTFWDTAKKVLLGAPTNAQCVINAEWSPDSRFLLTATLRPRLQVDNGFRVWDYHGRCVAFRACDFLYSANWRPLPASAFPPARAPSPAPAGTGSGVIGGGAPQKYVPPSMRGDSNTARLATEAMNVRYTSAGKIAPGATGVAAPAAELSKGQIKKAKERAKYEAARAREEAESALKALSVSGGAAAGGAAAASSRDECSAAAAAEAAQSRSAASAGVVAGGGVAALLGTGAAKDKVVRKLQKQLRAVEALVSARERGDALNELQLQKLEGEGDLRRRLADLGVMDSGVADVGDEGNQ